MAAEQNVSPGTITLMMTEADDEKGNLQLEHSGQESTTYEWFEFGESLWATWFPSEVPKKALWFLFPLSSFCVRNSGLPQ